MVILIPIILFFGLTGWLVWYMLSHDRGQKEPVGALWITLGLGLLGIVPALVLESTVLPANLFNGASGSLGSLLLSAIGIGIIEEASKFIPAALFLYKKRYFNEHIDGVLYFAIAGLGFGLPENILYTFSFGLKAGITRLILTPFFHAATTALAGYYLIRVKLDKRPAWTIGAALAGAMFIHGMYDFGLLSQRLGFVILSLLITGAMSVSLFILYKRATSEDRAIGLSAWGHNAFCRSCGVANPKHNLYCAQCGQHA